MKRILCDINIFLDIFLEREGHYKSSALIFSLVEKHELKGYICALTFPILFYILSKELKNLKAIAVLKKIRNIFHVAQVDEEVMDLSLSSNFKDFEDAVQFYSCASNGMDFLITRNKKDYKNLDNVLTPDEFMALVYSQK